MKTWTIETLSEMKAMATEIGQDLVPQSKSAPVVLALHGNLGAGKTTFVQYLAESLGIEEAVTSPTFVIMKRYVGVRNNPTLVHIDAYRIEDIDEMRVLGFERLLGENHTIICIEWAERIAPLLPPNTIHLNFEITDDIRTITESQ